MSVYNRVPLPADEHKRIETLQDKILNALKLGRQSNVTLSRIAKDYGRAIRALRKRGHNIRCESLAQTKKGGLRYYTLQSQPDPEWIVTGEVTLADGRRFLQSVTVRAFDMGTARNMAQHKFSIVKLQSATKKTTKPWYPTWQRASV